MMTIVEKLEACTWCVFVCVHVSDCVCVCVQWSSTCTDNRDDLDNAAKNNTFGPVPGWQSPL